MSEFDRWDAQLAEAADDARQQVNTDLAAGRLRMLDRGAAQPRCGEVDALREGVAQQCTTLAVVHDTRRGRDHCVGHALATAEDRARGYPEWPLLEA